MNVMARASRVFGSTVPALPFGNSQTVEVGEIKLQYIDLEAWGPEDSRDRSYKSRVEGYMRPLYNQIIDPDDPTKLIQSPQNIQNGQLTIVSEFGPVSIEDITHGDIHIKVNGESKITPKPAIGQARWTPYGYNFVSRPWQRCLLPPAALPPAAPPPAVLLRCTLHTPSCLPDDLPPCTG